ncbi:MAG TPA: hypothetical protein VJC18_00965, partial [bacterium]|nr:hypothetical protein [bacterium]
VTGVKSLHRAYRSNVFVQKPALHYLLHLGDKTIFYCSDTSYDGSFFFDVGKDQKIDLAILPVDHISPDLVAKKRFMNTRNALQAIQDMGAPKMIPYAFGAFNFASRKADKIVAQLKKDAEQLNLLDRIHVLAPGEEMVL